MTKYCNLIGSASFCAHNVNMKTVPGHHFSSERCGLGTRLPLTILQTKNVATLELLGKATQKRLLSLQKERTMSVRVEKLSVAAHSIA